MRVIEQLGALGGVATELGVSFANPNVEATFVYGTDGIYPGLPADTRDAMYRAIRSTSGPKATALWSKFQVDAERYSDAATRMYLDNDEQYGIALANLAQLMSEAAKKILIAAQQDLADRQASTPGAASRWAGIKTADDDRRAKVLADDAKQYLIDQDNARRLAAAKTASVTTTAARIHAVKLGVQTFTGRASLLTQPAAKAFSTVVPSKPTITLKANEVVANAGNQGVDQDQRLYTAAPPASPGVPTWAWAVGLAVVGVAVYLGRR